MGGIAIAIAIVLVMALYLLDKHGLLKRAMIITTKIFGFVLFVALLVVGVLWGYQSWRTARTAKESRGIDTVDHPEWQVVSESPSPNEQNIYVISYAEFARTKLFRDATTDGRTALLRQTDSFFAGVDKAAQQIIVKRLTDETKTDPEFKLPHGAMCAFDKVFFRDLGGTVASPCSYTVEISSCETPAIGAPPTGYTLDQDMKPCFTIRPSGVGNGR